METSMLDLLQSLAREAGYNYEIARAKGERGEEQSRAFVLLDLARRALRLYSPDTADQFISATYAGKYAGDSLPEDE